MVFSRIVVVDHAREVVDDHLVIVGTSRGSGLVHDTEKGLEKIGGGKL